MGATPGRGVHLAEPYTLAGHRVDIESVDLGTVTAEARKSHIVGQDQNDIGSGHSKTIPVGFSMY